MLHVWISTFEATWIGDVAWIERSASKTAIDVHIFVSYKRSASFLCGFHVDALS